MGTIGPEHLEGVGYCRSCLDRKLVSYDPIIEAILCESCRQHFTEHAVDALIASVKERA